MTIDPVQGGFAGYHNYYHPEEFIKANEDQGAIYLRDGQRAARVSEEFINGLHLGIEDEAGSAGGLLMYRCGYHWGLRDMQRFGSRMQQEFGGGQRDIWQMDMAFVFQTWWWPLAVEGFGGWRMDLGFRNKNITVVEIRNSAVAQSMALANKPVCHLYAGLFAGVFSYYDQQPRDAIEIQCYAMGNDVCKFLVGDSRQIDAASFWVKEGALASDILERAK